jgi:hypothetical protein
MSVSDREVYDAIITALTATRAFGAVRLDDPGGPGPFPLAVVSPGPWSETPTDDPTRTLRRASYRVTISVRGDDPRARFAEADRLSRTACSLLLGADFGEGCIPSLSRVDRGECRASAGGGEASCELRGTFSTVLTDSPGSAST